MRGHNGHEIILGALLATALWSGFYALDQVPFIALGQLLVDYSSVIVAFATMAIAAFTLTLWRSNRMLWRTANRSAAAAELAVAEQKRLGETEVRAYLSVGKVRMAPDPKGAFKMGDAESFEIRFEIFNAGSSPARNVRLACTSQLGGISGGETKVALGDIPSNFRERKRHLTFLPSKAVEAANAGDGAVSVFTSILLVYDDVFAVEHTEIYEFEGVYFFVREEREAGWLSFRGVKRSRRVPGKNDT
jgi:hypothetical protein